MLFVSPLLLPQIFVPEPLVNLSLLHSHQVCSVLYKLGLLLGVSHAFQFLVEILKENHLNEVLLLFYAFASVLVDLQGLFLGNRGLLALLGSHHLIIVSRPSDIVGVKNSVNECASSVDHFSDVHFIIILQKEILSKKPLDFS